MKRTDIEWLGGKTPYEKAKESVLIWCFVWKHCNFVKGFVNKDVKIKISLLLCVRSVFYVAGFRVFSNLWQVPDFISARYRIDWKGHYTNYYRLYIIDTLSDPYRWMTPSSDIPRQACHNCLLPLSYGVICCGITGNSVYCDCEDKPFLAHLPIKQPKIKDSVSMCKRMKHVK